MIAEDMIDVVKRVEKETNAAKKHIDSECELWMEEIDSDCEICHGTGKAEDGDICFCPNLRQADIEHMFKQDGMK